MFLTILSGAGILIMMTAICLDVLLRTLLNSPLIGAFDIVRIAGTIAISCALPYTTAVKGHVAIEYFFLKLNRTGKIVVDTLARLAGMTLFGCLAWKSIEYGTDLKASGEVTLTLQVPIYWLPWIISASCMVVVLVIFHNMLHPGREMIKP